MKPAEANSWITALPMRLLRFRSQIQYNSRVLNERRIDLLAILGLLFLVVFSFNDIVFQRLDQILAGLPTGVPNRDSLVVLFPFFERFMDSLRESGHLDPWNRYIWGGSPAIGNPNIPFNFVLYLFFHLSKPAFVVAMNWHLIFEFCAAAVGVYCLFRKLSHPWYEALLAAVLSVSSTSALWLTNTFCIFFHWVVIPWTLWILLTSDRRPVFRSTLYLAGLFYYQITYGQAQMSLFCLLFFLLSIFWIFKERLDTKRSIRILGAGYLMGGLLAAHFLIPMVEYLLHAPDRSHESWGEMAAHYTVHWRYLLHLFLPRLFWSPIPWWPAWKDGWSAWESFNCSIGPFFGVAAIYSFLTTKNKVIRRMGIFAFLLALLSTTELGGRVLVLLNMGRTVPFSRITHLILYPLLFGAVGEITVWRNNEKRLGGLLMTVLLFSVGIVFLARGFGGFVRDFFIAAESEGISEYFLWKYKPDLSAAFFHEALILFAVMAALALSFIARARRVFLGLALLIPLVDLYVFEQEHRQRGTETYPFQATLNWDNPLIRALQSRRKDFDQYFFSTFTGRMELDTGLAPNQNASLRIPSVNGYTSFNHRRDDLYQRFHRGNWGYAFSESEVKHLSIKYILVGPETPPLSYVSKLREIARYKEYRLFEYRDAQPKYRFENVPPLCKPKIRIESEREIFLTNPCSQSLLFTLPDPSYPWWQLHLDGKEVHFSDLPLTITPGSHRLETFCVPLSWYLGLALSFLTLLALVLPKRLVISVRHPLPIPA